jgi:ABC-type bacteriocin/lantibiotic exporter with double-glycine peptidase domain
VKDVTFGYDRDRPPLIERLSFTLPAGGRVALVGRSGCGKSTIANLVAGLYAPWSGEILFDGHPRDDLARAVLTSSVAKVDPDFVLFSGTVRDDLRFWDPSVDESRLVAAARDASIHDEIVRRPGGYGARVAEYGQNFSGGEAQRIEIARSLTTNPTLLILDEATSALDPETEQQIDLALRRRGLSCLVIAHRLSTIRDCDEIIVLDKGRVIQRGTHDQLIAVEGEYRTLVGEA